MEQLTGGTDEGKERAIAHLVEFNCHIANVLSNEGLEVKADWHSTQRSQIFLVLIRMCNPRDVAEGWWVFHSWGIGAKKNVCVVQYLADPFHRSVSEAMTTRRP